MLDWQKDFWMMSSLFILGTLIFEVLGYSIQFLLLIVAIMLLKQEIRSRFVSQSK